MPLMRRVRASASDAPGGGGGGPVQTANLLLAMPASLLLVQFVNVVLQVGMLIKALLFGARKPTGAKAKAKARGGPDCSALLVRRYRPHLRHLV